MALIKACIFDLDGVLVDTARYHYEAWKRLCNELGFDLTEAENEDLKGISRVESMEILLKKGGVTLSDDDKKKYMDMKNEWYLDYVDTMAGEEVLPGVVPFLYDVKESGRKIILGSASKNAVKILTRVGLVNLFDDIIDGTKVTKGKPHPQTFTLGAQAAGVKPKECVVFEDAAAGIEAALAAKMYAVGVGDPELLKKAHRVIPGFQQVKIDMLKEL